MMMVIVVFIFFGLNRNRDVCRWGRGCYRRVRVFVLRFTRHAFIACQVVFTVFDRATMPFNVVRPTVFTGHRYSVRRYRRGDRR
ncbi:Uncharacterised protein [Mycobacteroides abscessus subsp. massiliense]|nr:Uncharacterised protein [Mycobacteroides abscessus subsp. massiliense]